MKIPTEIAKENNMRITEVSKALSDLKNEKLVVCLNEHAKRGRLYQCTDYGKEVLEYLK